VLAGLPELQQLLQRCCMGAGDVTAQTVEYSVMESDERFMHFVDHKPSLMAHLVPQLQMCLMADVAAGLLVPG
jgi:hypothetical protein